MGSKWTGDYSQEGGNAGGYDAKEHLPKNVTKRFVQNVPFVNKFVWRTGVAIDSFTHAYHNVYDHVQASQHAVYTTQSQGGKKSMDNYDNHRRMLEEAQSIIVSLKRYLDDMQAEYSRQIDVAKHAGFMDDYTRKLQEKFRIFSKKVEEMITMIERHDGVMEHQKDMIEQLRAHAQQS
jgi:hypothetical protein